MRLGGTDTTPLCVSYGPLCTYCTVQYSTVRRYETCSCRFSIDIGGNLWVKLNDDFKETGLCWLLIRSKCGVRAKYVQSTCELRSP